MNNNKISTSVFYFYAINFIYSIYIFIIKYINIVIFFINFYVVKFF